VGSTLTRILQVVRDMHPREGGPPRVVAGTSVALRQAGHDVTIAATVRACEEAEVTAAWPSISKRGVKLLLFPTTGPRALGGSKELAAALMVQREKWDVTHIHGVWDQVLVAAARAARAARRPWFVSPHGMLDCWSMARSRWKKEVALRFFGVRAMLDGASGLVFGTRDEAHESAALGLRSPIEIIPNGVDLSMLGPRAQGAREKLRAELPQSREWGRIVLFYARLHPKKGLDLLVDAFARVASEFSDAALLAAAIPQDPTFEAAVRAQVAATGLGDRICITDQFTGPSSRFLLDAADVFVLPSHQEGFSIAVVEAMARGLPVLITDRCHLLEVRHRGAGLVTEPSADALADGLRGLLGLQGKALNSMGEAGRMLVAECYTWPRIASRLAEVYARYDHNGMRDCLVA
jgi:glycosyltransferase involved in cell wall biosynthesis